MALNLSDIVSHIVNIEKERISDDKKFTSENIKNSYIINRNSFIAHRYSITAELKKNEVDALNGLYTAHNLNRSFTWDACGYDSQVNTFQLVGTGNNSSSFLVLNDKFIVASELVIELRQKDRTDVTTLLGAVSSATTAFSLENPNDGVIRLANPIPSTYSIYASYKRAPLVVFDNDELRFERIGKEYYRTQFIFREVNS